MTLIGRPADLHVRFFSSSATAPRARRPTDAILLFLALAWVGVATALGSTNRVSSAIEAFITALPGLLGWFWEICDVLLFVWGLTLIGAAVMARGRWHLVRDQILALACAAAAVALLVEGSSVFGALTATGPPPIDPSVRIALASAVIATTAPHLGRPVRRFGRWLVPLAALATVALSTATPMGVITGLAIGYGSAALIHLVFGSAGGRPTPEDVSRSLADLGLPVTDVHPADLEWRGVATMEASAEDDRGLLVKIYGRDAWDGQLLNVTWSYLWYRDDAPNLTLSRLQQVEHEAFVTLLAERAGVPVHPVVAAGVADQDALLVVETRGRWLSTVADGEVTDELVHDLWRSLGRMHEAGIAHGSLDNHHLAVLPEGTGVIGDLAGATGAATEAQSRSDDAQLLVTTSLRIGPERAVAAARAELGPDGLAALLPYVQNAALTRATRRDLKGSTGSLEELRAQAAAAAGAEIPKLEPLRRVTWGSLALVVLLLFAAWAVFSAVTNVGVETIVQELDSANPVWLWVALLISPSVQVAEAFSTLGACPRPLRLGPVIGLQFAIRFIALAVPSSAARVALNVRFFQRAGLQVSPAIAVGLVDSVAGFVVQVVLVLLIWIAGLASLTISTRGLDLDLDPQVVIAIAVAAVVVVAIAVMVPRVRALIRPRLTEAMEALQVLRSPSKVLELFLGNLTAQVLLAIVLGLCLRSFGEEASLADLILVNTLASLLAGLLPIPGGIGVMEAAIRGGLIAVGVSEPAAVSTAILFRIITFYLPPLWGGVAMRRLRRHEYV